MTSIKPGIVHHSSITVHNCYLFIFYDIRLWAEALNVVCNFRPKQLYMKDEFIWGCLIMNALNHYEPCKWEALLSLLSLENSLRQYKHVFANNPNHMQNTVALVFRRSTAEENPLTFELGSSIRYTFKHSGPSIRTANS